MLVVINDSIVVKSEVQSWYLQTECETLALRHVVYWALRSKEMDKEMDKEERRSKDVVSVRD